MVAVHFPHRQIVDAGTKAFYEYKGDVQRLAAFLKSSIRWTINRLLQSFSLVGVVHVGEMHHGQFPQTVVFLILLLALFGEHVREDIC